MNVTVTGATNSGYVTAYPAGATLPTASNINFAAGQTIANLVSVKLGTSGQVTIHNGSTGPVQLIADVAGYYLAGTPTATGAFVSLTPARILDTRSGAGAPQGAIAAGGSVTFTVAGHGGIPAAGAAAVVMNVTVTGATKGGFITTFPDGNLLPTASNINFAAGQTIANLISVKLGTGGRVIISNGSSGPVQIIADVAGYYRN